MSLAALLTVATTAAAVGAPFSPVVATTCWLAMGACSGYALSGST